VTDDTTSNVPGTIRKERIIALLEELWRQGVRDERVLTAIAQVPRERFVGAGSEAAAWSNIALPIAAGQTISQPYVVALMTEALRLGGTEQVLEVGTGSGYQTAILCRLAASVISIERHPELAEGASALLAELGCENATIHVGDGSRGWPAAAPFDRIIVTASAPRAPGPLLEQLGEGGRMVIPIGEPNNQHLVAIDRDEAGFHESRFGPVRFVPLIGSEGWALPRQGEGLPDE